MAANPPNPAREPDETKSATYQINNAKLYVLLFSHFVYKRWHQIYAKKI